MLINDVKLVDARDLNELLESEMAKMLLAAGTVEEEKILSKVAEILHGLVRSVPAYSLKDQRPRYTVDGLAGKSGNRAAIQVIDTNTWERKLVGFEIMDDMTVRGANGNRAEREGEANED